jgi:hypothetical protein
MTALDLIRLAKLRAAQSTDLDHDYGRTRDEAVGALRRALSAYVTCNDVLLSIALAEGQKALADMDALAARMMDSLQ